MTLGDIIKEYRESNNMSMDLFSDKSGISKAYISLLEKNRHPKTGKPIAPSIQCIKQAADAMSIDFNLLFNKIDGNVSLSNDTNSKKAKGIQIPVLGSVPAGVPIEAIEDIVDYEDIDSVTAARGEYFGLKVKGASMEPRICEGDVLICRRQDDCESGDVAIVMVNGNDATVKRLKKYEGGILLIPNNPAFEPMNFTDEEIISKPVKVIGKVIENRQKY